MSLITQLLQTLQGMAGYAGPGVQTVSITEPADVHLELDVVSADRFSCSFRELRLNVPPFTHTAPGQLKQWADEVCRRVTYLLEHSIRSSSIRRPARHKSVLRVLIVKRTSLATMRLSCRCRASCVCAATKWYRGCPANRSTYKPRMKCWKSWCPISCRRR